MKSLTRGLLAAAFSIILPGSGQIYNGQKHKLIPGYSLFFLIPIIFIVFKITYFFWGLVVLLGLLLCIYLWNIGDAFVNALRPHRMLKIRYPVWLAIVPFLLFATNLYGIIRHLDPNDNILKIRPDRMATDSMAPTIQAGDFFMVATTDNNTDGLTKGKIITFYHQNLSLVLFKRLIAVSGDTVEGRSTAIYVNGEKIDEPYVQYIDKVQSYHDKNRRNTVNDFKPIVVPPEKLFVLGDNRNYSFDSRDPEFGFIDVKNVFRTFKPLYIYWSKDKSRIGKRIE